MVVPTAAELRCGKQLIPTDRLVRWAEESGFEVKAGNGTSHIHCRHTAHRDIWFNIIADSDKLSSQHNLADALKKLDMRAAEAERDKRAIDALGKISVEHWFFSKIPAYISVKRDEERSLIILRDRNIPQIGITLSFGQERLVENKMRDLDHTRRQAYELLGRCRGCYDIDVGIEDGVFDGTMIHTVYDIEPLMLAPYSPEEPYPVFFDRIAAFQNVIQAKDEENRQRFQRILGMDFIKAVTVAFSSKSRRGARHNMIDMSLPDGNILSIAFDTASMRRGAGRGDVFSGRIDEQNLGRVERAVNAVSFLREYHLKAA